MDPESQIKYLHIEPEGNNFTYPSFVIVHTFERTSLIDQLLRETSLNEVKILEIIVFVIIVVLSISNLKLLLLASDLRIRLVHSKQDRLELPRPNCGSHELHEQH